MPDLDAASSRLVLSSICNPICLPRFSCRWERLALHTCYLFPRSPSAWTAHLVLPRCRRLFRQGEVLSFLLACCHSFRRTTTSCVPIILQHRILYLAGRVKGCRSSQLRIDYEPPMHLNHYRPPGIHTRGSPSVPAFMVTVRTVKQLHRPSTLLARWLHCSDRRILVAQHNNASLKKVARMLAVHHWLSELEIGHSDPDAEPFHLDPSLAGLQ